MGSKRCSRRGSAGWKNWKKIIPTCPYWPGLTPTWWKTRSSCSWEQASSCEYSHTHRCSIVVQCSGRSESHYVIIIEISVGCINLMRCIFSFHQDRHLLPQSGGGRSKEDHHLTTGSDKKCKTSPAHIQLSVYVITKITKNRQNAMNLVHPLLFVSMLRKEMIRSF